MRAVFLFLLLSFFTLSLFAQIDKEFWFAAPDIAQSHGDRPIYLRVSTMEDTAHITLRMPAGLWFTPINQTINPNSTFSINLTPWIDSIENSPPNTILNRGLYLESDHLVTSYYECAHTNNPGIFSLKGKNALGKEFFIVSQNVYPNQVGQESFDIVATEDNTVVIITPSDTIIGHSAGIPFYIVLQKGQTFTARAFYTSASRTLAGSHIVSDKPVAVSWQDDSIRSSGAWDIVCDQIIPDIILGTDYIVIKGYAQVGTTRNNERVFACAIQDNTIIRLNGNPIPVDTIDAGQQYSYVIPYNDSTAFIQASHPVHLLHITGFSDEMGASVLPHDSCTGSRQIGFTRTNTGTFALLVLTRAGNQDSFYLNGSNAIITAADFFPVQGTSGEWVFMRKQFTTGQVPVGINLLKNTHGKFHLGILHMTGASAEYGYFSNFSSLYLGTLLSMCPGDSIELDAGPYMNSYLWQKQVSGTWVAIDTNRFLTVTDSGFYACLVNDENCTLADTVHIQYYPNAFVDLGPDRTICEGTFTTIDPGLYVSYLWSNGGTGRYLTTGTGDTYWVRTTNNNGCLAYDTIVIFIDSLPKSPGSVTGPQIVCAGQAGVTYSVDTIPFATSFTWTLPPGATGPTSGNPVMIDFSPGATSGDLKVRGGNYCGNGPELAFPVTVDPLPLPTITGMDSVCNNTTTSYQTQAGMTNYAWNVNSGGNIIAGGGTNTIFVLWDTPGTHQVNVIYTNSNNCTAVNPGKRFVNVHPLPVPAVSGPDSLCRNTTANYSTEPGMTGYSWTVTGGTIVSGGSTNSVDVQWNTAGSQTVSVSYTDPKGCIPLTPTDFNVQVNALPVPTISGNDTLCQGSAESYFTETGMTSYSWTISPGGTILSGSGTPSVAVQWNTAGSQSVTVNYVNSDGCAAQFPAVRAITVNPLPAPVISGPNPVCELSAPVYASPSFPGHAYNWTVTGGTIPSGQGTSSITVQWGVAGTGIIGLTETISATGCFAPAVPLNVTLNPYPLAAGGITGPSTVCENTSGIAYSILPVSFATSYSWTYSGTGVTIVNNGASITADFATGATGGTFSVQGVNGCGTGPSSGLNVTVNPRPVVSHITCNDPITTTTAQPFRLKGAIPPGGTYSGSGVTAGVFNPSVAGPGVHIITYGYTNSYACPASTTFSLSVVSPPPFACNNNFTDIRDNQQYPTVNIGGRCWMAMNLNYGTTIPSTAMQRDNCVPEKYCFNDNSSNCSTQGGLYQWDELMQFAPIAGSQGICPPGWHVPTETEWNTLFSNYISPGFAGDPLKYTGYSGFNAFLWGTRHQNETWDFFNFATMFWSSTSIGQNKAWAHGMNSYNPSVSWYPASRSNAFAVRCIKD